MADKDGVVDRRILPGTLAGVAGLICAVVAIVVHNRIVLVLATIFTVVAVVLILTAPDVPLRYRDRRRRRAETELLMSETDRLAARAARFEAEAIAARQDLAAAMLAEHARRVRQDRDQAPDEDEPTVRAEDEPGEETEGQTAPAAPPEDAELIMDAESGLFNQAFFEASLIKRISAARRGLRPLTLALIEILCRLGEPDEAGADPERVADVIEATVRDADTVARTTDGLFAVLLEDTPENGAIWTLERIRRRITELDDEITVRAGVSCYPAYGFDAQQLWNQASEALDVAREWRQDRIEVTNADPDD